MPHSNISIFVPHYGCPNQCSFCNQNSITGLKTPLSLSEVKKTCEKAFNEILDKSNTEIAFFGGSFTAINREYMLSLLNTVSEFIGEGKFKGIRISTRPDCIDNEILSILKKNKVTAIELGVQSMDDYVLSQNDRGHTAEAVISAVKLIKQYDFELGLQMMVGLYKSTPQLDIFTAEEIIKLSPDTVRIYPVVILTGTKLATLFEKGEYIPYSIETAVEICSKLIELFEINNIKIIKLGLHASELVESEMIGGIYHPAFKELCYNRIYLDKILSKISSLKSRNIIIHVPKNSISKVVGQKKSNIIALNNLGFSVKIIPSLRLKEYDIEIIEEETACT